MSVGVVVPDSRRKSVAVVYAPSSSEKNGVVCVELSYGCGNLFTGNE
jgi:hypothetical protein